jgi:aryl-phospho-beta-D-glucosidase BglC (GH1 family)
MKKLLLIITALLVSVGVFAQTSSDTWTVNKKDGTSENYKIVDNDGIKFTDENTFGNLMTGFENFGTNDSYKVSDVNSVTFSVYHEGDYSNVKLADASATTKTKKLYSYLQSIYGTKILSGIMANVSWNHDEADKVFKATGKYPAINCYDFIHIMSSAKGGWIDYDNITPVTEWSDANGIVSLMWHFNVPKTEADASASNYNGLVTCTPSETTFRAANVFTDGSWENKWFYGQMDKVCEVLLKLQDAGVVALWRPFHEAAGNATLKEKADWGRSWFWWGYDGADVYKKLWTTMFNYFQQKGIHNLIWVWTSQNYNGDESKYDSDSDWYPGDSYVDIIGRDLYGYDADQQKTEFTQLQARYPGKMITLAECGLKDGTTATADVQEAWDKGAKWSWFMPWYGSSMPSDSWWSKVVNEDAVITRDEVDQNNAYVAESAKDAVVNMGLGFNLGNTMDAYDTNKSMAKNSVADFETCWGQPVTTNAMMKFLKDGGINAVRVPVTWFQHMDADGTVDKAWMDRVQEIVDYVINNGMYCILNVHHDTGAESNGSSVHWIKADVQNHTANQAKFKNLWTQIASRFKDYSNKLLFEGYNEMLDASSTWGAPKEASSYTAVNAYAQDFVDAVRATGGNNATRNLIVNTYAAANSDAVLNNFTVPTDKVSGHIAVEIHSYDPWNWFSNKGAWDSSCQTEITNMFTRLNNTFVSKGVPVVIGEYGTHGDKSVSKSSTDAQKQAAADQAADIVKKAKALGIATFYWMSIFQDADRTVPQWTLPIVVEAMNKAYNE